MNNLREHFENELRKVEKEIEELREVNKTSAAKQKRVRDINLILDGITAREQIDKLRQENKNLRKRLMMEGIDIDENIQIYL